MGIVTSKERAEDTMKMAGIVFGEDFVKDNPVLVVDHQLQFAAGLGRDHARRDEGLCARTTSR